MIHLQFEGSAKEVREEMLAMLGLDGAAAAAPAAETKAPGKSKPVAKSEPKTAEPATAAETTPTPSTQASAATAQTSPSEGAAATRASVAPRCSAYAQKAGPEALKQLFIEMGAANGKFSEVPEDKIGALDARLAEMGM